MRHPAVITGLSYIHIAGNADTGKLTLCGLPLETEHHTGLLSSMHNVTCGQCLAVVNAAGQFTLAVLEDAVRTSRPSPMMGRSTKGVLTAEAKAAMALNKFTRDKLQQPAPPISAADQGIPDVPLP